MSGGLELQTSYLALSGVPTGISSAADLFFFASIPGLGPGDDEVNELTVIEGDPGKGDANSLTKKSFNAYGSVAKKLAWAMAGSVSVSSAGNGVSGAVVGSVGAATIADVELPSPSYPPGDPAGFDANVWDGWYASDQCIIVRWNVAGGFEYVGRERPDLFRWVAGLQNAVNRRKGVRAWTRGEARERWRR